MSSQSSFGSKMRPLQHPKPGRPPVRPSAPIRLLHLWKALSSLIFIQMLSLRIFSASTLHENFQNVLTIIIWIRNEAIIASQIWSSARPLVRPSAPVRPLHLYKVLSSSFFIQMLSLRTFSAYKLHKHFQNVLTITIWIQNKAPTASQTWSSARPPVRPSAHVRPLHLWRALLGSFWIQMMTMRTFWKCL